MTNPAIIDPESIENLRSLNPGDNDEFLREIVEIFLEDTPKRLDELTDCLGTQDVRRFTRAAHSIKGSSTSVPWPCARPPKSLSTLRLRMAWPT